MTTPHGCAVLLALLLSACDHFYGPKITNGLGTDVVVTIDYTNGETSTTLWPSCRTSFIGKEGFQVERVSFQRNGMLIREFGREEILQMIQREQQVGGYTEWFVGPSESVLLTGQDSEPCTGRRAVSDGR
jgi:hypothetical protein